MRINYVTTNETKIVVAQRILAGYGVEVEPMRIETPEIQSVDGKDVCQYSARYASRLLGKEVVKSDVSYSIPALHGFPGPFVKYVNSWLGVADVLALLRDKSDRRVFITEYVCLAKTDEIVHTFFSTREGTISDRVHAENGSMFDKLVIPKGHATPQNTWSEDDQRAFFTRHQRAWHDLGRHLNERIEIS